MVTSTATGNRPLTRPDASLLLVEDDVELADLLRSALQGTISHLACAGTLQLARQRLSSRAWNLVLLDVQLPDGDGFDLCRELRAASCATAVLMLTARASEADRVTGLGLGADDYLTKPFSLRELVLRVGNLLRRQAQAAASSPPACERIACGDIVVQLGQRRAFCQGSELALTPREFDLLAHLACHPDRVFTRAQLLQAVWGARFEGFEHTVNSHINRLRSKLESDPRHPIRLVTVWGAGYRLTASGQDPLSAA